MTPTMFGPYRLEGLLGRGGMGEVHRAFDTAQNRVVALKCLLPHLAGDPDFVARFRRESEIAARLREPHVIPIHRYGQIEGRLFLDMRLVEGGDLGSVLRHQGPFGPERAVHVIGQVAAALEASHDEGLVHRDVKPSNVLVSSSRSLGEADFVYLVDFGIARPVGGAGITSAGAAIGSVEYMAPERFGGGPVDHRADIYSLGCLLFECLTGRRPFTGNDPSAVLAQHLTEPPPAPSAARPDLPGGFDRVVATAMAKDPAHRFDSVAELAHAARAVVRPAPVRPAAGSAKAPAGWWTRLGPDEGTAPAFDWGARAASPPSPPAPAPAPTPAPAPARAPTVPDQGLPPSGGWWDRQVTALHPAAAPTLTIGQAADCDVVLADELVSPHHAQLRRAGDRWELVDLGGWTGTHVNGRRIGRQVVTEQDVIGIGHALLRLQGGTLVEYTDDGDIHFAAADLVVTRSGRRLLDRVSFSLPRRSLLAVVGPSGAGKSTLLGALTGRRPADTGRVDYDGRDLYDHWDELRQRIGQVPQDDILHPQLTVRRALRYAAELRFPADTGRGERHRRVEEVIAELGLADQARQRISTLSGGQRKRTSVALELLTRPSLLFLDEPTSGLDPGMDKSVMQTLRGLADGGRTVVVVTHAPAQLDLCDRVLVLASGGRLAYFGPPQEALAYFGQADYADMFLLLDRSRDVDWTQRFRDSDAYARFVPPAAPRARRPAPAPPPAQRPARRRQPVLRQFGVLARRYLATIAADRAFTVFLLLLPLVLSAFAHVFPGGSGLSWAEAERTPEQDDPRQVLLLLVLGCAFLGYAMSFRELVKERSIFDRERAFGLSPGAYLASKLGVLGVIGAAQATLVAVLGTLGTPPPAAPPVLGDGTAEVVVALVAVTVSITALGLATSAVIANPDRGMPILVVVLIVQLLLCGMLFPVHGTPGLEQASWLLPARWGFAMGASTAGLPGPTGELDPLWRPEPGVWLLDLAAQVALTVLFSAAALAVLRRERRR